MRTFMVFEYIHPSGIKLRPARPLTNSIYNPGCICVKRTSRAIDMLVLQVIEGLKKVVEYWGDSQRLLQRDYRPHRV